MFLSYGRAKKLDLDGNVSLGQSLNDLHQKSFIALDSGIIKKYVYYAQTDNINVFQTSIVPVMFFSVFGVRPK